MGVTIQSSPPSKRIFGLRTVATAFEYGAFVGLAAGEDSQCTSRSSQSGDMMIIFLLSCPIIYLLHEACLLASTFFHDLFPAVAVPAPGALGGFYLGSTYHAQDLSRTEKAKQISKLSLMAAGGLVVFIGGVKIVSSVKLKG